MVGITRSVGTVLGSLGKFGMGAVLLPVRAPGFFRKPAGSVFGWVALSVVSLFLLFFVTSILALVTNAGGLGESDFVDLALTEFRGYLAWSHLILLLKGYGIICASYIFLLYPIISVWLRKKTPTRWGVFWRTMGLVLLSLCAVYLRLFWFRPYFTDNQWFPGWLLWSMDAMPAWIVHSLTVFFFDILPLMLLVFALGFYVVRFRQRFGDVTHRSRRLVYSLGGSAALAVVAFFLLPGVFGSSATRSEEQPMNVIIIASDSLRADHLSCNGYERPVSPNIDALASRSVNFTKCFTPIGSTLESMVGMLSSQYPHTHGMRHMFPRRETVERFNADSPSLARILRDQGYDTAVMGDWCASIFNAVPMDFEEIMVSDFDNFKVWLNQAIYLNHFVIPFFFDNEFGYWLFPQLQSFSYFLKPEVVTDRVVKRLDKQSKKNKPFFWTIFYSCNHLNYHSPDPYYKMWTDPEYDGPHKHQVSLDPDEFARNVDIGDRFANMPQEDIEQIIGLYDGCTTQFDDCVGRVVDKLRETGQLENTIIIVTSDHGDDLFEPNVTFCHGITFSGGDQGNNIPFVFYIPGLEDKAREVDKVVRNIDMAPTICELLGAPMDPRFEGESLMPYVNAETDNMSLAFYGETSYLFFKRKLPGEEPLAIPALHKTTHIDREFDTHIVLKERYEEAVEKTKERVLRTEDWKLVYTPGQHAPIHRLYHLVHDPHCERDVKAAYPEIYRKMKKHLWLWIDERKESRVADIMSDPVTEEIEVPERWINIDWGVEEEVDEQTEADVASG